VPVIHIGFTGTRIGMTLPQLSRVNAELRMLHSLDAWFHHGDCVGADAEASTLARLAGYSVMIHPPVDEAHRARCIGDVVVAPLTHLARNRAIVCACDTMIAAPREMEHQSRGGTWYTHDYALKVGKPVILVLPDGTVRR